MRLLKTSLYWQKLNVGSSTIHDWLPRDALRRKEGFVHPFSEACFDFLKEMLSTISGEGHGRCCFLPTSVCATTNIVFPIEEIYSGLIYQHALENILKVSQRFIKLLHQPTKPHGLVGQFPSIQKGKQYDYDSIYAILYQLKEYIGEPIATR